MKPSVKKIVILLSVMVFLCVTAIAQNTMTITFENGEKQKVNLVQPSCNIESIQFNNLNGPKGNKGQEYEDTKGNKVMVPCGELAFASRVVSFYEGSPKNKRPANANPDNILGEPNYRKASNYCITLGCEGSIVIEFTHVRLVDIDGVDLYVFEVGPAVEDTKLEISKNGRTWIDIGRIKGGKTSVDIADYVSYGDQFRFVRLTDLKSACGGSTPGADIDAVAAIGCVVVN